MSRFESSSGNKSPAQSAGQFYLAAWQTCLPKRINKIASPQSGQSLLGNAKRRWIGVSQSSSTTKTQWITEGSPPRAFQMTTNLRSFVFPSSFYQLSYISNTSLIEGILNYWIAFVENSQYFEPLNIHPMAISNNPIMHGVRGSIGKLVVFRIVDGKQIVGAYPDMSGVKRSSKQKKQNKRMAKVNNLVAKIKADPEQRNSAQIRLNVPSNKLHHALLKEQLLILSKQG